jgi:hypothetical protein
MSWVPQSDAVIAFFMQLNPVKMNSAPYAYR